MSCGSFNVPSNFCDNPCAVTQGNTVSCESLPSQIENFTTQFFGEVIKTEVDGVVSWSLPCGLDVGLPNNPRAVGEGLACYFLRLFEDGIVGLTGPQGIDGDAGTNGNNAYTVTLQSFTQPTLGSPHVQVFTAYNPAILSGSYIFIDTSGWYLVDDADVSGVLFLTLSKLIEGTSGTVSAGKLVVPSGFPGSVTVESAPTLTNAFYYETAGTNYELQTSYQAIDFGPSAPRVLLPTAGRYLLTGLIDGIGLTGIVLADEVSFKLFETINSVDVPGSEHTISMIADGQRAQICLNAIFESNSDNQEVGIYARASSAGIFSAIASATTLSLVKLQ